MSKELLYLPHLIALQLEFEVFLIEGKDPRSETEILIPTSYNIMPATRESLRQVVIGDI
jgi:hypothetical protein